MNPAHNLLVDDEAIITGICLSRDFVIVEFLLEWSVVLRHCFLFVLLTISLSKSRLQKTHLLNNVIIKCQLKYFKGLWQTTAAATGLFDGKFITAHASDYDGIKVHFSKPQWIQNTSLANNGNLLSTAGVSNAVEGSLFVIKKLFGSETMHKVINDINYGFDSPRLKHQSNTFHFGDKVTIGKKILFRKNKKVGVLLQNGINEFEFAAIMDTYNRTFPGSIESLSANDIPVRSKYGLTFIPTGKLGKTSLDELHVINPVSFLKSGQQTFKSVEIVNYDHLQREYIINKCLNRIGDEYGAKFENTVKLMLDYN